MSKTKPQLLIVEDDISSQQYYSIILGDLYELTIAPTAESARQFINASDFRLALIDISLPGEENGLDLIRFLAEHEPTIRTIVISAHAFPRNRQEALDAGAVEYFTKPIMSRVLVEIIQKYYPKD